MSQASFLKHLIARGIDLVLPPRCIATGDIVDAPGKISPRFWQTLHFIHAPLCKTCGVPFDYDADDGYVCASCLAYPPHYTAARAAVVYDDASKKAILSLKYGDQTHVYKTFSDWIARAGHDLLSQTDLLIPVPLHPMRLWSRRFNQAGLIADGIARHTGIPVSHNTLRRAKKTKPHKALTYKQRTQNVKNAFAVNPAKAAALSGKTICLIDDVMTTGATVNACAILLKTCGVANVYVLTVARAKKD